MDTITEVSCLQCKLPVAPQQAFVVTLCDLDGNEYEAVFHKDGVCVFNYAAERLRAAGEKLKQIAEKWDEIRGKL